ncbi:hypothetical protein SLS58_007438 [Diplodia intermedia]|uniref:Uncharacterized protein n=1 Tax=Diplodia intermedia TaxID=856260 RepID=A0ABR3TJY4_9PEZI
MRFSAKVALSLLLYGVTTYSAPSPTQAPPRCPSSTPEPHNCDKVGTGDTGSESSDGIGNGFTLSYELDLGQNCHAMHNFRAAEAEQCYNIDEIWFTCRPALSYDFDNTGSYCTVWEARDCDSDRGSFQYLESIQAGKFGADGNSSMTVQSYKCVANDKTSPVKVD